MGDVGAASHVRGDDHSGLLCDICSAPGDVYFRGKLYCARCGVSSLHPGGESIPDDPSSTKEPRAQPLIRLARDGDSSEHAASAEVWTRLRVAEWTAAAAMWVFALLVIARVGTPVLRLVVSFFLIGTYLVLRTLRVSNAATTWRKARRGLLVWLLVLALMAMGGWLAAEFFIPGLDSPNEGSTITARLFD